MRELNKNSDIYIYKLIQVMSGLLQYQNKIFIQFYDSQPKLILKRYSQLYKGLLALQQEIRMI